MNVICFWGEVIPSDQVYIISRIMVWIAVTSFSLERVTDFRVVDYVGGFLLFFSTAAVLFMQSRMLGYIL